MCLYFFAVIAKKNIKYHPFILVNHTCKSGKKSRIVMKTLKRRDHNILLQKAQYIISYSKNITAFLWTSALAIRTTVPALRVDSFCSSHHLETHKSRCAFGTNIAITYCLRPHVSTICSRSMSAPQRHLSDFEFLKVTD